MTRSDQSLVIAPQMTSPDSDSHEELTATSTSLRQEEFDENKLWSWPADLLLLTIRGLGISVPDTTIIHSCSASCCHFMTWLGLVLMRIGAWAPALACSSLLLPMLWFYSSSQDHYVRQLTTPVQSSSATRHQFNPNSRVSDHLINRSAQLAGSSNSASILKFGLTSSRSHDKLISLKLP